MNARIDRNLAEPGFLRSFPMRRDPSIVMHPDRLAAMQPSRVSATRFLVSRAAKGRWKIACRQFDLDEGARGIAVYEITAGSWDFSFILHSFEPSKKGRTGRIIGTAWDMMGSLVEGRATQRDIDLVGQEMPQLYHGRASPKTLIWCRSNRSDRVFDDCVDALAAGRQPAFEPLLRAGYIMRNTGLDGNGTFGTRNFQTLEPDHPLRPSLSAQMLTGYMMRVFAADLVHHLARAKGGDNAVELRRDLLRYLGIGNGSALGLMFFVNNHPLLIDRWLGIREECIAQAKLATLGSGSGESELVSRLLQRAIAYRRADRTRYRQLTPSHRIADDLTEIHKKFQLAAGRAAAGQGSAYPLADFAHAIEGRYVPAAIETFYSILIELVPDLADSLVETLAIDEELVSRPEMALGRLREILHAEYGWAYRMDLTTERSQRYIWYKSANAEEPRRGIRAEAPDAFNLGLDLPRLVVQLDADLAGYDRTLSVARFLLDHPQYRRIVTRIQALAGRPYHSPRADIMSEDFIPVFITRLVNGPIHGLEKTEDAMGRDLRGVLLDGAPLPDEFADGTADPYWYHPAEPAP
jgi:hypothetical protein